MLWKKKRGINHTCNICKKDFRSTSRFARFCRDCKKQNEVFRFAEWLPEGVILEGFPTYSE